MRGIKGSVRYKDEWKDKNLFPVISQWIQGVSTGKSDDVHFFRCKICKIGKLSLSNMGIGAVKKHMTDPSPRPSDLKPKKCKHNQIMDFFRAKMDQDLLLYQGYTLSKRKVLAADETVWECTKRQNEHACDVTVK